MVWVGQASMYQSPKICYRTNLFVYAEAQTEARRVRIPHGFYNLEPDQPRTEMTEKMDTAATTFENGPITTVRYASGFGRSRTAGLVLVRDAS